MLIFKFKLKFYQIVIVASSKLNENNNAICGKILDRALLMMVQSQLWTTVGHFSF